MSTSSGWTSASALNSSPKRSSATSSCTTNDIKVNQAGNALVWFRNDLRITDHLPLLEASDYVKMISERSFPSSSLKLQEEIVTPGIIGIYFITPEDWHRHHRAPCQLDLIFRTLVCLRRDLALKYDIPLIVMQVDPSLTYAFPSVNLDSYASHPNVSHVRQELQKSRQRFGELLQNICRTLGVTALFFGKEVGVDEKERDEAVKEVLMSENEDGKSNLFLVHEVDDCYGCAVSPGLVVSQHNKPYTIFTPFRRRWLEIIRSKSETIITPLKLPNRNKHSWQHYVPNNFHYGDIPNTLEADIRWKTAFDVQKDMMQCARKDWPAPEEAILSRIDSFLNQGLRSYKERRDQPERENGTSRLSAYLSIGSLSIRTLLNRLSLQAPSLFRLPRGTRNFVPTEPEKVGEEEGPFMYLNELAWRDFYQHILYFYPRISRHQPFQLATRLIPWRNDVMRHDKKEVARAITDFQAWCEGKTGYPLVDAGMRQLRSTGWMHNRVRMVVASFLVKDLQIDWRWGERYFAEWLIDYDFSANNGGWQWSASTGTDAQPYFRIFNPILQSMRYDPDGNYIRRYVPELKALMDPENVEKRPKKRLKYSETKRDRPTSTSKSALHKAIHDPYGTLDESTWRSLDYAKPIVNHAEARDEAIAMFKSTLSKRDS